MGVVCGYGWRGYSPAGLAATGAHAEPQSSIHAVDPASVMQGDTVALTITGEDLPTGGVVVEFFPQQIAVIKILVPRPPKSSRRSKSPASRHRGSTT